jgi:hypothetical protein
MKKDLFNTPEKLPIEVQNVLNKYGEIETYDQCKAMLKELTKLGYTFEYYLDAQPYDLQKIKSTKVQFFYDEQHNDLFAFFPEEKYNSTPGLYTCYAHVGQHSACHIDYIEECKKATPKQYKDLKEELINIGYNLKIV